MSRVKLGCLAVVGAFGVLVILFVVAIFTPGRWQEVEIPLPSGLPEVTYVRRALPNFVGVEHERYLSIGSSGRRASLPIVPDGQEMVDVYLVVESRSSPYLILREIGQTVSVYLPSGGERMSEDIPPEAQFIGTVQADPHGVMFILAAETEPSIPSFEGAEASGARGGTSGGVAP